MLSTFLGMVKVAILFSATSGATVDRVEGDTVPYAVVCSNATGECIDVLTTFAPGGLAEGNVIGAAPTSCDTPFAATGDIKL